MSILEIKISDSSLSITYGGDLSKIARDLGRIGLENPAFGFILNSAVNGMKEEARAIELRDEMIGFIFDPEQ